MNYRGYFPNTTISIWVTTPEPPYGSHSFQLIYQYTRQGVEYLFSQGCPLVILACNTASARALRQIQMCDLANSADPTRRVLGVIRPTVEYLGSCSASRSMQVGLVGTEATVASNSYQIEIEKYAPNVTLTQKATPLWAALVERARLAIMWGSITSYSVTSISCSQRHLRWSHWCWLAPTTPPPAKDRASFATLYRGDFAREYRGSLA